MEKGVFFFADDPWAIRMVSDAHSGDLGCADDLCPSYGQAWVKKIIRLAETSE